MRSAESRVSVVENIDAAVDAARNVYGRFRTPRPCVKVALAVGAGLAGVWVLRRAFAAGGRRVNEAVNVGGGRTRSLGGAALWLLVQGASAMLLPVLRDHFRGIELGEALKRMHPSHIFFRWLGLEK